MKYKEKLEKLFTSYLKEVKPGFSEYIFDYNAYHVTLYNNPEDYEIISFNRIVYELVQVENKINESNEE